MNWRYCGVQEPKLQEIPQPPKYEVVWGKDTVHLKYPMSADGAFKTTFRITYPWGDFVPGLVNLFQTVAAFQPGR